MNYDHPNRKELITGKSGSGKTTFWLDRLKKWPAKWKWAFDPEREVARKIGWPAVTAPNQLLWSIQHRRPIAFDPEAMFPGDRASGFEFFCLWVWNVSQELDGVKLFACDEVWKYVPAVRPLPHSFALLLEEGRKQEIDLCLVSQRINKTHDAIRAVTSDLVTFQHTDSLPLKWLNEYFDPEAVRRLKIPGGKLSTRL